MSRYWTPLKSFRCTNDCRMEGCPGHQMRIVYVCTSDTIIVEIDPKEGERPGSAEWQYVFNDDTFATMVDLEIEQRAKNEAERAVREATTVRR